MKILLSLSASREVKMRTLLTDLGSSHLSVASRLCRLAAV